MTAEVEDPELSTGSPPFVSAVFLAERPQDIVTVRHERDHHLKADVRASVHQLRRNNIFLCALPETSGSWTHLGMVSPAAHPNVISARVSICRCEVGDNSQRQVDRVRADQSGLRIISF